MGYMDPKRAEKIMKKRGIDALIASSPENFFYSSGTYARPAYCPAIALIPADSDLSPAMIVNNLIKIQAGRMSDIEDIRSYSIWVCLADSNDILGGGARRPMELPEQYHTEEIIGMFSDLLTEKGLKNSVIGIESNFFIEPRYSLLKKQNPKAKFVNAEGAFWELRQVKTKPEIEALKDAIALAENGVRAMIEIGVQGSTISELHLRYKRGVWEAANSSQAMSLDGIRATISSGDYFNTVMSPEYRVAKGDIIFIDNGVTLYGYTSDMGRTFSVGRPSDIQKEIFSTLKVGYEAGLSMIRPGVKLKEIYWQVQNTIRKNGLDWHFRGHMGHMIGAGYLTEQPPWISKDEETVLENDMVLCLEIGTYLTGPLGAFQIEDALLINSGGYELLNRLSRDMIEL